MLYSLGFTPSKLDVDVWIKAAGKPNGFAYYELILVYVDDILSISHAPIIIMATIKSSFRLKEEPSTPKT